MPSQAEGKHLADLQRIVGTAGIKDAATVAGLDPGLHPENLGAGMIILPACTEEVAQVVSYCARYGIAMVPHGGRTGISGGGVSRRGQIILQTTRMNRILSVDPLAGTAVVESGVTLEQVESEVAGHGLSVGIDLGARGTVTIGGMVSTNAGGIEAFRNGVMRHRVLGLEAVLPDGRVLDDLKRVTKANEGYDVKQLFIGAEGTLGIVTKVALELLPREGGRATALVSCRRAGDAVKLFRRLRNRRDGELLSAELMWPDYARTTAEELRQASLLAFEPDREALFAIIEVADDEARGGEAFLERALGEGAEAEELRDAVIAKNRRERETIWMIREESFLCDRKYPHGFWYDISVPLAALDDYAGWLFARTGELDPDLKVFMFGHLGDGNLHLTVTRGREMSELAEQVSEAVYAGLAELGGSFSAEHGIGIEKRDALARHVPPEKLAIMRAVKQAIDPLGIMNPGKVLP
jgi:FAD/FMN-containing dehydrogenase